MSTPVNRGSRRPNRIVLGLVIVWTLQILAFLLFFTVARSSAFLTRAPDPARDRTYRIWTGNLNAFGYGYVKPWMGKLYDVWGTFELGSLILIVLVSVVVLLVRSARAPRP